MKFSKKSDLLDLVDKMQQQGLNINLHITHQDKYSLKRTSQITQCTLLLSYFLLSGLNDKIYKLEHIYKNQFFTYLTQSE